jgi:hypothetical protein
MGQMRVGVAVALPYQLAGCAGAEGAGVDQRDEGPALPSEIIGWKANSRPDAPSNFGAFSTAPPTLRYQSPENQLSAAAGAAPVAASAMAAPIHLAIFMSVAHANTGEAFSSSPVGLLGKI